MKALFYLEIVLFDSYSDKDYKFEENESYYTDISLDDAALLPKCRSHRRID